MRRQVAMSGAGGGTGGSTFLLARAAINEHGLMRGLWLPGLEATCYRAFSYTGFRIGLYPTVRDAIVGRVVTPGCQIGVHGPYRLS